MNPLGSITRPVGYQKPNARNQTFRRAVSKLFLRTIEIVTTAARVAVPHNAQSDCNAKALLLGGEISESVQIPTRSGFLPCHGSKWSGRESPRLTLARSGPPGKDYYPEVLVL